MDNHLKDAYFNPKVALASDHTLLEFWNHSSGMIEQKDDGHGSFQVHRAFAMSKGLAKHGMRA